MALYQPTNLIPSSFRGEGGDVIDASKTNTFSLQLNGNSPCIAYQLIIMQNDTDSTIVYDSGKYTLASPLYPRDYENNVQRLSISVPSNSGMTNGYSNGYKWVIILWADEDTTITSNDTFFWAKADPTFTVSTLPGTISEKSVTITATYTQVNGAPLEWFEWVLTDTDGNVVKDTGKVYSQEVKFVFDGLLNDTTYDYSLMGETDDGVTVPTVTGSFYVSYEASSVEGTVSASCDKDTGAITISWDVSSVEVGFTITKWFVYRLETGTNALVHITDMLVSSTSFTDYLVKNNATYTYYIFPTDEVTYGTPLVSSRVGSTCWNWVLFVAQEETDDVTDDLLTFNSAYVFQGNVNSGSLSNNAAGQIFANFTRYPKVVKGTQNYISGKLTALIGHVDTTTNTFVQAKGLMQELMELSTLNNRMFLKNRAGDIWEVAVHEPTEMQVQDTQYRQPYTASIPWVEVGSIVGVSLTREGE